MSGKKDVEQLAKIARAAGWTVETDKTGHLSWTPPEGGLPVRTAATPSDFRSIRKIKNDLRKRGLEIPHGSYTPPKASRGDLANAVLTSAIDIDKPSEQTIGEIDALKASLYESPAGIALGGSDTYGRALIDGLVEAFDGHADLTRNALLAQALSEYEDPDNPDTLENLMATIGATARVSGGVVAKIAQAAYEIIREAAIREGQKEGGSYLYPHSIKWAVLKACKAAGVDDSEDMENYSRLVYALFKDNSRGTPAAVCLRRYVPAANGSAAVPSLWSIAESWVAPESVVPLPRFVSERDRRMQYVEDRLTPEQAGENRNPEPVTVINLNNESDTSTATTEKDDTMSKKKDTATYACTHPGCDAEFPSYQALGGHMFKHNAEKRRAEKEAAAAATEQPDTKPLAESTDLTAAVRTALLTILSGPSEDEKYEREVQAEQINLLTEDVRNMSAQIADLKAALEMVNGVVNLKAIGLDADALGLAL